MLNELLRADDQAFDDLLGALTDTGNRHAAEVSQISKHVQSPLIAL